MQLPLVQWENVRHLNRTFESGVPSRETRDIQDVVRCHYLHLTVTSPSPGSRSQARVERSKPHETRPDQIGLVRIFMSRKWTKKEDEVEDRGFNY
jgi:hypothetical protein